MDPQRRELVVTLVMVNLASIMERADEALLPASYREIGLSLHVSPTSLGSLTLLRSTVQMLCFPLAAYMSSRHNRAHVIAFGALLWASATFCVGASTTFLQVAISRGLNGIGLAMVIPAIQSLVADAADPERRGVAFGWLQFTANMGGVFGNVFSVLLAGTTVFGLAGWRAAFHIIGMTSVIIAFLVCRFAVDPVFKDGSKLAEGRHTSGVQASALQETFNDAKFVVKIPTFLAIVAQGVAGTFPWAALSFAPMWLELTGFSHNVTATIIGSFMVSNSLGGLFGGWLGDIFAKHLPNTGRIILAQFSSGIGVPFGAITLLFLPYDPSTGFIHGTVFFTMGFLMSWCGTATNNPIFAEIVPERMRTSIYALDRSLESVLASFAPPLVGILAERVFGYVVVSSHGSDADIIADKHNAVALGKALYVAFGIPFAICSLLYTILYWTYPKDRDKARVREEEEMEEAIMIPGKVGFLDVKGGYISITKDVEQLEAEESKMNHYEPKYLGEKQSMLSDIQ